MSKAKEIITTQEVVRNVLETKPYTRNSDDGLIYEVCKKINPLCANLTFEIVIKNRKSLGLPAFETIRRTGQKMREQNPELRGNDEVQAERELSQKVFRDYARGTV